LTAVNGLPASLEPLTRGLDLSNELQAREAAAIVAETAPQITTAMAIRMDFSTRFLCKLAIGLGDNLFGPEFGETAYAGMLRDALMERDFERRGQIGIKGTAYSVNEQAADLPKLLGFTGAWAISLIALKDNFVLTVSSPNGAFMSVQISDDPSLWVDSRFDPYRLGQVHVIAPQGLHVGPVDAPSFVLHGMGMRQLPELLALEQKRTGLRSLPLKGNALDQATNTRKY
jgi:hypothetical protein